MEKVGQQRDTASMAFCDLYEMAKALLQDNQLPVQSPAIAGMR